jgi:hypothetical protein
MPASADGGEREPEVQQDVVQRRRDLRPAHRLADPGQAVPRRVPAEHLVDEQARAAEPGEVDHRGQAEHDRECRARALPGVFGQREDAVG